MLFRTYPHTWQGLVACYQAAVPFFRTTLASDAVYVAVLFGGYEMFKAAFPAMASNALRAD